MEKVCVIGAGSTKYGKLDDSITDIAVQASVGAIESAGIQPKEIEAGTSFSPVVHHNDIFKTIAAAAKAELPKDRKLDGFNFLPFVKGEKNGEIHQTIFWRQGHQQTVYHKGWKLIRTNDENQKWLFNLNEDPTEKNNLIKYFPEQVNLLDNLLDNHNSEQIESMWPSVMNSRILIDKHFGEDYEHGDEYIYWPN